MSEMRDEVKAGLRKLLQQLEGKLTPETLQGGLAGELSQALEESLDVVKEDLNPESREVFDATMGISHLLQESDRALLKRMKAAGAPYDEILNAYQHRIVELMVRMLEIQVTRMLAASGHEFDEDAVHQLSRDASRVICDGVDRLTSGK